MFLYDFGWLHKTPFNKQLCALFLVSSNHLIEDFKYTTLIIVSSATHYLELHNALTIYYNLVFLPKKIKFVVMTP